MDKLGIKTGTKLDLQIITSAGDGPEFKSSFAQDDGGGMCLIAVPMKGGKACLLEEGTRIALSYAVGQDTYSFVGTLGGAQKKGARTYLVLNVTTPPKKQERRIFARIAAELDAEITSYRAASGELLPSQAYPARTSDVSQGGLSLHTDADVVVGEIVGVAILQPVKKSAPPKVDMQLQAKVCWVRSAAKGLGFGTTIGVQFLFSDSGEMQEVKRFFFSLSAPK